MTSRPEEDRHERLVAALPTLELASIHLMELGGRRLEFTPADDPVGGSAELLEVDSTQMAVTVLQSEEWLIVRVSGGVTTEAVRVAITIDGRFSKTEPTELDDETLGVFVERVAIMAMYPFVRQAVHDMSSRLGAPATLQLLRAGQILVAAEG